MRTLIIAFIGIVILLPALAMASSSHAVYKCGGSDLYVKIIHVSDVSAVTVSEWKYIDAFGNAEACVALRDKLNSK